MLFNVEVDSGDSISLYVVPDNVSGVATVVARSDGQSIFSTPANELRQALVDAGRHQTGECGFRIHESALPGLSGLSDLELYDADTALLLYRRPKPHFTQKKVLRIETHLFPLWRLDEAMKSRFQYFSRGIDALGRETTTQMFLLHNINSVYLSGRILFSNYRHYVDSHFDTIFVMHHPLEEMAERLLLLSQINRAPLDTLGMRDAMSLQSTIAFAQSLPFHDEDAMRKAVQKMPPNVAQSLSNPVVRQLTSRTPDEMPSGRAVSMALDHLSSFAIVGLRRRPATVVEAIAEWIGASHGELPRMNKIPRVESVARMLKRSRVVDILLEKDLELYNHIAAAFKKLA
jgi:hypothetical protein